MKKLSTILAALVLFAGVSFAQQNPDPAKGTPTKSATPAKTDKKAPAQKADKKTDKKGTSTKAAK